MNCKIFAILAVSICLAACASEEAEHRHGALTGAAAPIPAPVVDLGNTVCPVWGEKVGDSKLWEVYEGKVYHFCCDCCPQQFKKDPAKYAKAVAADPANYGMKRSM
jgi:YHS domain-containing protein